MNVIYDVAVLGAGRSDPLARTGIFRVVENTAHRLAVSREVSVSFHASRFAAESIAFIHDDRQLDNELFPLSGTCRRMFPVCMKPAGFHLSRLKRRLFDLACAPPVGLFGRSHIFHSPFYPFPQRLRDFAHLKRFLTVHDLIPILHPEFFTSKMARLLLEQALEGVGEDGWVLCDSRSTRDDVCAYLGHLDPSRVFVAALAAPEDLRPCDDGERLSLVRRQYAIPDGPYLLCLGTLEPRKNTSRLIRCFARMVLQEKADDLSLVLTGAKGWDYGKVFDEVESTGALKGRIVFTGFVDSEDLAPLYSGALAFVYPSFYEGFGLPPLEAMQCGTPVITSNTSSLPEVVGDAGIMVAPTDEDGLCEAMVKLYRQPALRAAMAERALARAATFTWDAYMDETIRAYRTAVES
jgi:glycosyltransferase involved in cell wall biosynthesis